MEKEEKTSEGKVAIPIHVATPSRLIPIIAGLFVALLTCVLFIGLHFGIEVEAPTLEIEGMTAFIGAEEIKVTFRARDSGSGVRSVTVEVEQEDVVLPVGQFEPEGIMHEFTGSFGLSKSIAGLREGPALVRMAVQDRSLWGTISRTAFAVVVDSYAPSLQILSAPRVIDESGVGLFVYRAGDVNLTSSGLSIGGEPYISGRPAVLIDPDLLQSDLFGFVAPVPPGRADADWTLFATDVAGHSAKAPIAVEVRRSVTNERVVREYTSEGALIRVLAGLSKDVTGVLQTADRRNVEQLRQDLEKGSRQSAIAFAKFLLSSVRARELQVIRERLASESPAPRSWRGALFSGSFGARIGFGDRVIMADEEGELVSSVSIGEVLEPIGDTKSVVAPYSGTVRMAGRLGTLGEIVVIDHGAGVVSVFYSLDQRHVFEGSVVSQGQALADIGMSGFHTSRAARMLFLVNGQAVDPAPWRRPSGFGFTVEGALNGIKGALGIESSPVHSEP
jgi:hypothetical protein